MQCYSAITKNEIVPFAVTWMNPEMIMLNELVRKQILYDITYMWNLKYNTNQYIYKPKTDSQPKRKGVGGGEQRIENMG